MHDITLFRNDIHIFRHEKASQSVPYRFAVAFIELSFQQHGFLLCRLTIMFSLRAVLYIERTEQVSLVFGRLIKRLQSIKKHPPGNLGGCFFMLR